jgi:EAL domain-containing protein (putative c-di-GMP-specific phosphodiesterase class I)
LSYLRQFPVDLLKVDQSFVRGMGGNGGDGALGRAIIRLAHTVGIRAVAEGVESAEQLRELQLLGCDLAQGFHISRALTADEFVRFLDARRVVSVPAAPVLTRPG